MFKQQNKYNQAVKDNSKKKIKAIKLRKSDNNISSRWKTAGTLQEVLSSADDHGVSYEPMQ